VSQNPLAGLFALPVVGGPLKALAGKGLEFVGNSVVSAQQGVQKVVGQEPLLAAALIGQVPGNGLKATPLPSKIATPLRWITLAISLLTARNAVASPATQKATAGGG
jgi:hypothetical protein